MSGAARTVDAALARARALGLDRLDAQLLIAHLSGRDRAWVIAHGEAPIEGEALDALFARRAQGEPLAYLVGEREFRGLAMRVTPAVLVPRPDTETLVDWALECIADRQAPRVIDLGTGSGAIALALKAARPDAQVHAVDASAAALAVARDNAARHGLEVTWHLGSWWQALPADARFDLALSNPPYVATGDPHLAALRHEPIGALVPAGDDGSGLADIERIVAGATAHLASDAWLLLEHGAEQAAAVRERLLSHGFADALTRRDLAGRERVSGARRPI